MFFKIQKVSFFSSDLRGEVAFACENFGFSRTEIIERTENAIKELKLNYLQDSKLDVLSSGEKQKVAVASVYALCPNIYVCDEPTANLDDVGIEILLEVLRELKNKGCTLIITEHRIAWLLSLADEFVYVADGDIIWNKSTKEMLEMPTEQRLKYGLRSFVNVQNDAITLDTKEDTKLLSSVGLWWQTNKKMIFSDKNIDIPLGKITALVGKNGAGKSSFAMILTGLCNQSGGDVILDGKKLSPAKRRNQIWYSANDTSTQFFTSSDTDELLLNSKKTDNRLEFARTVLKNLGLYQYKDAHPASLSGGQKQRLSIACGILSNRQIIILDEPTSGLDGGNMKIIADILKQEKEKGKTILVITHDQEFISLSCDKVIEL